MIYCSECGNSLPEPNSFVAIDKIFRPATSSSQIRNNHSDVLRSGLSKIESAIEGQRGDPGKLYPLDERVRRVIGALQDKIRVFELRGRQ